MVRDSPDGGLGQAEIAAVGGQRQDGSIAAGRRCASEAPNWPRGIARANLVRQEDLPMGSVVCKATTLRSNERPHRHFDRPNPPFRYRPTFAFAFGCFARIAASPGQSCVSRKRTPCRRGVFGDRGWEAAAAMAARRPDFHAKLGEPVKLAARLAKLPRRPSIFTLPSRAEGDDGGRLGADAHATRDSSFPTPRLPRHRLSKFASKRNHAGVLCMRATVNSRSCSCYSHSF